MQVKPIENYGVIGDLHTAALVGLDGSLDYLPFPRFDAPTVFAALLDPEGGHFSLAPLEDARHKQLYVPDTNILLTRFFSEAGIAEVTDFMPTQKRACHRVVRRVKLIRGEMRFLMVCAPRFDYARAPHRATPLEEGVCFTSDGLALRLRGTVPLELRDGDAVSEFVLRAGETASFVLEQALPNSPAAHPDFVERAFEDTLAFWQGWSARATYRGRWREEVLRSALTLKLLTYAPEGSIVAAPTFGLPEELGGARNWDYRYTWIRDASFTVYALSRLGYTEEMAAFMNWVVARGTSCAPDGGGLQPLYGLRGEREVPERILPNLRGYGGSSPVRVGNAAYEQTQLDVYGALMDSVYLYNKYGEPISFDLWRHLTHLIDWVCDNWRRPDHGIWEVRGETQAFLYSRLMCWVAVDRGFRLALKRSFPAPLDRWRAVRDEIYLDIFENFWSDEKGAFVQYEGSEALDAACLLMPLVRFVGPRDPRWLSTLRAVERELVEESLVYRYRVGEGAADGLDGGEGSFNVCSFWLVECLSRAGEVSRARLLFEKFLGFANHLGLFAEETGPYGQQLGNFPQAFTHLGLISAAYELNRKLSPGE